jgi:uncharacterized membrane protein YkvA (DUF1232 family)
VTVLRVVAGLAVTVAAAWVLFVVVLAVTRPDAAVLRESIRLVPDVVRLCHRLTRDRTLPRRLRVKLWLLLGYLALPIDLVTDFIPVLGHADDAIVVALVLRSVIRHAGPDAVRRHWPGTAAGLATIARLCRLDLPAT